MSLSDAEKKLYGWKNEEPEKPVVNLKPEEAVNLKNSWDSADSTAHQKVYYEGKSITDKISIFAKAAFWLILLAVIGSGIFVYYLISQYNKTKGLDFDIDAPQKVMLAKPFDISINIENKSQNELKQAEILIKLPEGVVSLDGYSNKQIIQEELSDLKNGEQIKKTYSAVIVKGEQTVKEVDIIFSYFPPNIKTRFERKETVEITVDQAAISLNLNTPQTVFGGEAFDINVNYKNISNINFSKAKLQFTYPVGFIFKSASATSTASNNIWELENIIPEAESAFSIKGFLQGPEQSFYDLKAQLYLFFNDQEYLIAEKTASLSIASAPLSLQITANNSPNYVSFPDDTLQYQITYKNNTDVGLNDVIVKAKISGEMFDLNTLRANGNFDSTSNTITWSAANTPEFKFLPAGNQGNVSFSIKTKPSYPIKRQFDKNFSLKVQAEINSPTVPANVSSDKTVGLAALETKIKGRVDFIPFYVLVSGSNPPRVDKATTYEIHWTVKNYSTDVKDVKVKSFLQSGAQWLNVVKSNIDSIPVYNERTGEIIWDISKITATKGVISKPTEATFQVKIIPNLTQVNQGFLLLSESFLQALDEFANLELNSRIEPLKIKEAVKP